jgi:hypothetical protein
LNWLSDSTKPTSQTHSNEEPKLSNLLNKVFGIRETWQKAFEENVEPDRAELYQIALRDYLGTSEESDADRLANLLPIVEVSDSEYAGIVKGIGTVCESTITLELKEEEQADNSEKFSDARARMLIAKAEVNFWSRRVHYHGSVSSANSTASRRVREAREANPLLFDESGKPVDVLRKLIDKRKAARRKANEASLKASDEKFKRETDDLLKRQGLTRPKDKENSFA